MTGTVEKVRSRIRRLVPEARFFVKGFDLADAVQCRRCRRNLGLAFPIPPKRLRTQVGPDTRVEGFLEQGKRTAGEIRDILRGAGRTLESFERILDFGCGCGRQMRWLADLPQSCRLYGSDVFAPAIRWNQRHLRFAEFAVNGFHPPLPYEAEKFDLIFAISVFTHFNEPDQLAWVEELHRVAAPGATLLPSTHGEFALDALRKGKVPLSDEFLARLNRLGDLSQEGFLFEPYVPGSNYGLAFHDIGYIREHWGRKFRILKFIPRGQDGWQDVVVLEKERRA